MIKQLFYLSYLKYWSESSPNMESIYMVQQHIKFHYKRKDPEATLRFHIYPHNNSKLLFSHSFTSSLQFSPIWFLRRRRWSIAVSFVILALRSVGVVVAFIGRKRRRRRWNAALRETIRETDEVLFFGQDQHRCQCSETRCR